MRRGLVVGKFMPLHRGHQLMIETALANVDELTVVVYDTKVEGVTNMPVQKRAGWISALYPQIQNVVPVKDTLEGDHAEHDDPKYAQHYAHELAFLGPFTHVFSSEDYGEPFAQALGAGHVLVDRARELVPISGTMIREDTFKYRAFVDPLVYRSLIQKVVFVGTESTGKSTLARELAERHNTMYTQEYGRSLWQWWIEKGIEPTFDQLYRVGKTQYEQEQAAALHSDRYLFCDTNAWTTMLWSEMYYGTADARLYDLVERTKDEYIWFLCDDDFGWVDDGLRELKGGKAAAFQTKNYERLANFGLLKANMLLTGDLDYRVSQVEKHLGLDVFATV